uniref:hypothetical protein n=1 Tax=Salmonella sp. M265 TaxID=3240301 RepID=UPI00352A1655
RFGLSNQGRAADKWLAEVVRWTWKVKLYTHLETDLFGELRDGAEDEEDARAPRAAGNAPGLYDILGGGLVAALFSLWSSGFKVLAEGFSVWLSAGQAAFRLSPGFSLALVGAGYLMGL